MLKIKRHAHIIVLTTLRFLLHRYRSWLLVQGAERSRHIAAAYPIECWTPLERRRRRNDVQGERQRRTASRR